MYTLMSFTISMTDFLSFFAIYNIFCLYSTDKCDQILSKKE